MQRGHTLHNPLDVGITVSMRTTKALAGFKNTKVVAVVGDRQNGPPKAMCVGR